MKKFIKVAIVGALSLACSGAIALAANGNNNAARDSQSYHGGQSPARGCNTPSGQSDGVSTAANLGANVSC